MHNNEAILIMPCRKTVLYKNNHRFKALSVICDTCRTHSTIQHIRVSSQLVLDMFTAAAMIVMMVSSRGDLLRWRRARRWYCEDASLSM